MISTFTLESDCDSIVYVENLKKHWVYRQTTYYDTMTMEIIKIELTPMFPVYNEDDDQ